MSKHTFQVTPLSKYEGALYPSLHEDALVPQEKRTASDYMKIFTVLLFSLCLALGLLACFDPLKLDRDDENDRDKDDDYDIPAGVAPPCTPGEAFCSDTYIWTICGEDSHIEQIDCNVYCQENMPDSQWGAYSRGCDIDAEDPCQCSYDVTPGVPPACTENDLYCEDNNILAKCNEENQSYDRINCEKHCQETHGEHATSLGCDADAQDPCQCDYDIIAGVAPACMENDIYCEDEETLAKCIVNGSYEYINCQEQCEAKLGSEAISRGCNADTIDPCQCDYDIIAGEPMQCTPNDIFCHENNIGICNEYGFYEWQSCVDYCGEQNDDESQECDPSSDDPCGCDS